MLARGLSLVVLLAAVADAAGGDAVRFSFGDGKAVAVVEGGPANDTGEAVRLPGRLVGQAKVVEGLGLHDAATGLLAIDRGAGHAAWADPGPDSAFDRGHGETLAVEAWVRPDAVAAGRHMHILGKGRTGNPGVPADHLNYAVRLTGEKDGAALSFVFRSAPGGDPARGAYHRWTSAETLPADGRWHHVALSYKFGEPESVAGLLDGRAVKGKWDMGGPTKAPPAVDEDELWIGSGVGGSEGSTFHGRIAEVSLHRGPLVAAELRKRFPVVAEKPSAPPSPAPDGRVLVEIFEDVPTTKTWDFRWPAPSESYEQAAFGFTAVPRKYSDRGVAIDRSPAFAVRAASLIDVPPGEYQVLLRARNGAKLRIDGREALDTPFFNLSNSGHGTLRDWSAVKEARLRPLQPGDHESVATVTLGGRHEVRLEFLVGGANIRPEVGETGVFLRRVGETDFHLLGHGLDAPLTDAGWAAFADRQRVEIATVEAAHRRAADRDAEYWERRHELARQVWQDKVPADGANPVDRIVAAKLAELGVTPPPVVDDWAFLRRVTLDVTGTVPTPAQEDAFFADAEPGRRDRYVDRLLTDAGWADHWTAYWQDLLAENPNLVNPTLGNTGPFRWWIHESFRDDKPFDRFAAELIRMDGSVRGGGPGGFSLATGNDVPMAAKAHALGQALLAIDMTCARCHDSPQSDVTQADLFGLAAMLGRAPQEVPKTSTVPPHPDPNHVSLIESTLRVGEKVPPGWAFDELAPGDAADLARDPADSRDRLAALVTAPRNERFVQVIVNRVWKRYLGRGLVEPAHAWPAGEPRDPELLDALGAAFVDSGYDIKTLARLILTSETYQRQPLPEDAAVAGGLLPVRRRMTAEQVVDAMFTACGKRLKAGQIAIDADGARSIEQSLNLGRPRRAWEFTAISNERDRPSLSLPKAQPFATLMEAFGWPGARSTPVSVRDEQPSAIQPGLVANGVVARRFARPSDDSAFTALALNADSPGSLIDAVFRRTLTRPPTPAESAALAAVLADGFADRVVPGEAVPDRDYPTTGVSWSNHLHPDATRRQEELAAVVTAGDPPTARLRPDWRERYEDVLWAVLNTPEFVFVP